MIAITDETGAVVARYSYDAWGKCTVESDTSGVGIANINPFRYRSYYYDAEIGMYYLQSRYYDPEVGRFINADEVTVSGSNTILSFSLFAYCDNSPVNNIDYNGNILFTTIAKCILGAAFGLLVQLVSDLIEYAVKKYLLNRTVSNEFAPTSPLGDYIGSAVSWALNTLSFSSKLAKLLVPIIPVAAKHITNAIKGQFRLRDFLVDFGYALLTGVISIALSRPAEKKLSDLKKKRKRNSKNLQLKATKKTIKLNLNLKLTKLSISITSLDSITILILNILLS